MFDGVDLTHRKSRQRVDEFGLFAVEGFAEKETQYPLHELIVLFATKRQCIDAL